MTRDEAIEAGARGVHERDRGVAWANGDESQPTWDAASERLRSTARDRAAAVLDAVGWRPEAEHAAAVLREAAAAAHYAGLGPDAVKWLRARADALGGAE